MKLEIEEIRELRRRLGLNQAELAKLAGVSQSLIAKIESRKIDPSYSKVSRIFEALAMLSRKKEVSVEAVMKKNIIKLGPKIKVTKAVELMKKHAISQIPVVENGRVAGLITESIIISHLGENLAELRIGDIMDNAPPVVSKYTSVSAASDLLKYFPIIIVAEKGRILGIVAKADILKSIG